MWSTRIHAVRTALRQRAPHHWHAAGLDLTSQPCALLATVAKTLAREPRAPDVPEWPGVPAHGDVPTVSSWTTAMRSSR